MDPMFDGKNVRAWHEGTFEEKIVRIAAVTATFHPTILKSLLESFRVRAACLEMMIDMVRDSVALCCFRSRGDTLNLYLES